MSTATERIMRERGDLKCLHEPFMYYYYLTLKQQPFPFFDVDPNQPASFEGIVAMLEETARNDPVFFKDMGYYVSSHIQHHPDLASRWQHVFIIRDPRKSILSYHRLDPGISLEEIGLEAQWQLYEWIKETKGRGTTPASAISEIVVLRAEALQRDPVTVMNLAWKKLGLGPADHAFQWNETTTPTDWQAVAGWHESAQASMGITQAREQTEDEMNRQFNAVADDHPKLHHYLAHHWPFYEKLKAVSDQQFGC